SLCICLLKNIRSIFNAFFHRYMIRHKRHVYNNKRFWCSSSHGFTMMNHIIDSYLCSGIITKYNVTILVGDSLGNVVLGYDSTTQVTIDDMVHHGKAVRRGAPETFVVVDMPLDRKSVV